MITSKAIAMTGVSIESVSAMLGVLYNRNIDASMAGTGLANMFTELMSPTKKLRKVMKELGIEFEDVNVNNITLQEAMKKLKEAGLTSAQAMELFGKRSGKTAITLLGLGEGAGDTAKEISDLETTLDNAGGTAKRVAEVQVDTLTGSFKLLASATDEKELIANEKELKGKI